VGGEEKKEGQHCRSSYLPCGSLDEFRRQWSAHDVFSHVNVAQSILKSRVKCYFTDGGIGEQWGLSHRIAEGDTLRHGRSAIQWKLFTVQRISPVRKYW
jgi:hypothetical protein